MTPLTLQQLLIDGEGSTVEFKRDAITPQALAKEMVAFANLRGGVILLGVEDDGTVSGVEDRDADERVLSIARDKIRPPIIPSTEWVTPPAGGHRVLAVTIEPGFAVEAVWHDSQHLYYIRVGKQSRDASPEELARLYTQRGLVRSELRPVGSAGLDLLDLRRLRQWFGDIRQQAGILPSGDEPEAWQRLLLPTELMVKGQAGAVCTVASVVLFGREGQRVFPAARVNATAYPGVEKDYATLERATLAAPLAPLLSPAGDLSEPGLINQAATFVRRNIGVGVEIRDERRVGRAAFPEDVIREAVTNAVVHRDYTLASSEIELDIFADRIEIISPGRLANGMTVEGMLLGARASRNEAIVGVARDYNFVDRLGLGIPRKIVTGMWDFNGTAPEYDLSIDERVKLTLRR